MKTISLYRDTKIWNKNGASPSLTIQLTDFLFFSYRFRQYFLTVLRCGRSPPQGSSRAYSTSYGQCKLWHGHIIFFSPMSGRLLHCTYLRVSVTGNQQYNQSMSERHAVIRQPNGHDPPTQLMVAAARPQESSGSLTNGLPMTSYYHQNGHTVSAGPQTVRHNRSSRVVAWFQKPMGTPL